nr:HAMP domain-containing histidine kinase [Tatlockia sp.]
EFIANMGHDLATPISDVGSIAQMLSYYIDDYPEFKELFETLVARSEACEKVRKHILNATSVSNLELKTESFSILQDLLELEKEFRADIDAKNLKLIIHPIKPKRDDLIETDRVKFHAILGDLLSNAINFTEEGQLSITTLKEEGRFHIQVSDTGIGIPADKYDYIFEQYTKLSRSNKYGANFKGVGAGLYLARVRANILGATICIKSELGKGSTFTLSIPAHPLPI